MKSVIDELERIFNEMTDEEFLESYRESTKGMRDTTEYDDFFSERPCEMEFEIDNNTETQYEVEVSVKYYNKSTLDNKSANFLLLAA